MFGFLKSLKILKKGPRGPERTLTTEEKKKRKDEVLNTDYVTGDRKSPKVQHHIKDRQFYGETVDPKYYDGRYNTRAMSNKIHKEYHKWKKKHPPASNRWIDHKKFGYVHQNL